MGGVDQRFQVFRGAYRIQTTANRQFYIPFVRVGRKFRSPYREEAAKNELTWYPKAATQQRSEHACQYRHSVNDQSPEPLLTRIIGVLHNGHPIVFTDRL
jgi:hypothetical protein